MKYRPEIDGLRGFVVIFSVFFHAGFEFFAGGHAGLEVFFVISGFVITGIILVDLDKGRFTLANFYERRIRRILPATILVVFASLPFAWSIMLPADMIDFAQSVLATATFTTNLLFLTEFGYFDQVAEYKPLLTFWSLSLEEQFYVLFPLFMLLVWRLGIKWVIILITVCIVVSFILGQIAVYLRPREAYFLLPTRGWALLLGALTALYLHQRPGKLRFTNIGQAASFLGFLLIIYAIFFFDRQTPIPGIYSLFPAIGAVLVIVFAAPGTIVHSMLSHKSMVGLGLVSFSIYLWHQPMFAFARLRTPGEPSDELILFLCALTFVLSYLSWKFVEQPFRDRKRMQRKTVFSVVGCSVGLMIAFGLSGIGFDGWPQRIPFPPNLKYANLAEKSQKGTRLCSPKPGEFGEGVAGCFFGDTTSNRAIVLLGDSHSRSIQAELGDALNERGIKGIRLKLAECGHLPFVFNVHSPASRDCAEKLERLAQYAESNAESVLIAMGWTVRLLTGDNQKDQWAFDNEEGGIAQKKDIVFAAYDENYNSDTSRDAKHAALVRFLDAFPDTLRTHIFYQIPEIGWDIFKKNLYYYQANNKILQQVDTNYTLYKERNRYSISVLDQYLEGRSNFSATYPDQIFCDTFVPKRCAAQIDGDPLYVDSVHVSASGANLLLKPFLEDLDARKPVR